MDLNVVILTGLNVIYNKFHSGLHANSSFDLMQAKWNKFFTCKKCKFE